MVAEGRGEWGVTAKQVWGFLFGVKKMFWNKIVLVYNFVNILKTSKLYTLKDVCYVNDVSIKMLPVGKK